MSCHGSSCGKGTDSHHHHHHSHSHGECCNECCSCSCHSQHACGCGDIHSFDCADRAHHLLSLANAAWMEVLKDKIKEHILANDSKIDEMARIIAETNREFWHGKMAEAKAQEHYENRLSELFENSKSNQGRSKK